MPCNRRIRTLDGALQPDLLLRLVQEDHEFRRGQQFALPYAWQVRRNFTERFWGRRDDRTKHGAHEVLGLRCAVENGHDPREVSQDVRLRGSGEHTRDGTARRARG